MLRWRTTHPLGSVQDRGGCFWARHVALTPAERRRTAGSLGRVYAVDSPPAYGRSRNAGPAPSRSAGVP